MKNNILMSLTLATALAVFGVACGQPVAPNGNAAISHNGANQNANIPAANANTTDANHEAMDQGAMNHGSMTSDPNAASAPYDLQFIDTMIAHHQGAVDMAKMAEGKTQNAELKKFTAQIIADQERKSGR